jgi:hypothetical protein
MPNRVQILALAVGAAFIAVGLWQLATAPVTPVPDETGVAAEN